MDCRGIPATSIDPGRTAIRVCDAAGTSASFELPASSEDLDYIAAKLDYAARLAASGKPVWGGPRREVRWWLNARRARHPPVAACVTLVTIPGAVFFLPDEPPQLSAVVIASAMSQTPDS